MFPLNQIAFYFSFHDIAVVLFNMEFADSSCDSGRFAGFNLFDIEEPGVDYELDEDISDIVGSVHTLDLSDLKKFFSSFCKYLCSCVDYWQVLVIHFTCG